MKNLKTLSHDRLLEKTKQLAVIERKVTTQILWHLHEIESRKLFAKEGYSSLFEYAVGELGYSDAAAGRRISAMRLMIDAPEIIEPALQRGDTNLSTLCTLQTFFKNQDQPLAMAEKKDLILALHGQSKRVCEKKLAAIDPKPFQKQDREKVPTDHLTEIRFVSDDALLEKLKAIKELDAHFQLSPSYLELFHRMADLTLDRLKSARTRTKKIRSKANYKEPSKFLPPAKPIAQPGVAQPGVAQPGVAQPGVTQPAVTQPEATPPAELKSQTIASPPTTPKDLRSPRFISAEVRRQVWERDQGRCQYRSPSGRRCGSRFAIQIDHITPVVWGGRAGLSNLQLLCCTHNQYKAIQQLRGRAIPQEYSHVYAQRK